jgi:DNA invertase Pin-like site-specific DNA recombinase
MAEFEAESAKAMEYLIRKWGPVCMRLGGSTMDSRDEHLNRDYKPPTTITPKMTARMIRLYKDGEGMNIDDIAAEIGVGRITVWRHLRKNNAWRGHVVKKSSVAQ